MMNPEWKLIEHDGKVFAYHFSLLTAEAAEIVREIADFKALTDDSEVTDVTQVLRSCAAEWRILALRYLLRRIEKEHVVNYSRAECEVQGDNFVRNLPDEKFDSFATEVLTDFFTNTKRAHLVSALLQNGKSKQKINPLLMNLIKSLNEKKSQDD